MLQGFVQLLNSIPDVLRKLGVSENCEMTAPFIIGHPKAKQAEGKKQKLNILKCIE
jgi:hypothetical protein